MKSKTHTAARSAKVASVPRREVGKPATKKGHETAVAETAVDKTEAKDRRSVRRQKIIECAARQFAERGYDDCDMDCVAAKVGVAKGTLYLYFPGKQDLFFACVDWGMAEMQRRVHAAADAVDGPVEKLSRGIRAYLEYFETHPEQVELLIQERAIFRDRKQSTYFEYRDANRGPWRELYLGLVKAGRMRSDVSVERILDAIGSLLYGTMFTNHFVGRTISLDEQHRALLAIIFRGTAVKGRDLGE
jgi:AcrR family transcriptional regulator